MVKKWSIEGVVFLFLVVVSATMQLRAQSDPSRHNNTSHIQQWLSEGNRYLSQNNTDSAISVAQKAYTEAFKENRAHDLAQSELLMARSFRRKELFPKALSSYLKSLNKFERLKDNRYIPRINFEIGQMYFEWDVFENAIPHLHLANHEHIESGEKRLYFQGVELVAQSFLRLQQTDSAIFFYNQLLNHCKIERNRNLELKVLETIVDVHKNVGDYDKAIEKELEILNYNQLMNDAEGEFATLNNIGFLYKRLNNSNKALEYFQKALWLSSDNANHKAAVLLNIGVIYLNKGDEDNGFRHIFDALDLRIKENNPNEIGKIHNLLAATYLQTQNFESAINNLQKAESIGENTSNQQLLMRTYEIGSRIYQEAGSYEQALLYFQKYVVVKDELEESERQRTTENLSKKYFIDKTEKELKLDLAQEEVRDLSMRQLVLEKEKSEKELALSKENEALLEKQYKLERSAADQKLLLINKVLEAEKKDREISELHKDQQIQEYQIRQQQVQQKEREQKIQLLASNNRLLAKEKELEQLHSKRTETQRSILIGIVLIALVSLMLTVILYIRRKRKNELLKVQNQQILSQSEEVKQQRNQLAVQNEKINDSLLYAEKIQAAVFSDKLLNNVGFDYFVLNKPRDIVSGDFHKIHVLEDKVVIAVADCTGHGIPGAMLSMLGASFLNQIITEKGVGKASLILEEMRIRVKKTLDQDDEKMRGSADGMDIALCIIDKQTNALQFAGAYSPLYIIRGKQIIELKADRQPIGVYPREKPFTNHEFQLQSGDRLYAYTDGFIDQMNKDGMKFLGKRLQAQLIATIDQPLAEQKRRLQAEFEKWQGNERQTDDVLLMGIEV